LLYFRALAVGLMGVVAPLSAVIGAGLPLVFGIAGGEQPGPLTFAALVVALLAIALATAGTHAEQAARASLLLGLAAGVGFGLFFIALDATPPGSGLWPLIAARIASVTVFGTLVLLRPQLARLGPMLPLAVLSGMLDMTANILFLLATRAGSLAASAVLVSLYPVVVVLLARVILREHLSPLQLTSVGLALAASSLISTTS
jgi:EamA domain-containing membrane protein RarD